MQIITESTLVYLLFLLGLYGIFFEFVNPGFVFPAITGTVVLLIALYVLQLLQAAQVLAHEPQAMQLRYLQTLASLAGSNTSTVVFPMPIELGEFLRKMSKS